MKQSSPKWAEAYAQLIALMQKYETQTPSVEELDCVMELIKVAMKDDVDNREDVPDKSLAKGSIDAFCDLTKHIIKNG